MATGDDHPDRHLPDDVPAAFVDDPERVLLLLESQPAGPWCVFETFAADGSLAIGISATPLPPGTLMVVYEGLTRNIAEQAAAGLHRWRRRHAGWG